MMHKRLILSGDRMIEKIQGQAIQLTKLCKKKLQLSYGPLMYGTFPDIGFFCSISSFVSHLDDIVQTFWFRMQIPWRNMNRLGRKEMYRIPSTFFSFFFFFSDCFFFSLMISLFMGNSQLYDSILAALEREQSKLIISTYFKIVDGLDIMCLCW